MGLRVHGNRLAWAQVEQMLGVRSMSESDWLEVLPHVPDDVEVDWVTGEFIVGRWRDEEEQSVSDSVRRAEQSTKVFRAWSLMAGQEWRELDRESELLICERLKEGWCVEDLVKAADSAWSSDWHVRNGQTTIRAVYKDSDRVTEHLTRGNSSRKALSELDKARRATMDRRRKCTRT